MSQKKVQEEEEISDRDAAIKVRHEFLERENQRLKKLVVQLSETVIRNVIRKT